MAPVKAKGSATQKARKSATSGPSKTKVTKRPPPKQVKTKPASTTLLQSKPKRTRPRYTDAQLNLPALNSIVPASATAAQRAGKGTGKKKNKIYIDDQESMMTILAMVNAEKEGVIESKMIKQRQLEDIREARRKEAEQRAGEKKGKFEEAKKEFKSKSKGKRNQEMHSNAENASSAETGSNSAPGSKKKRKSVSFA